MSGKTILIIEDDQDQAMLLARHAKSKGYVPKIAYDSIIGFMMMQQVEVDLVILDLGLPGGGGLKVLDNMKRSFKTIDIPVVVLTALTEEGLEEKARQKGAIEYFKKPCPMETLFGAIETILG